MLSRLAAARGLEQTLLVGLRDVMSLHGAEMGNIQLVGEGGQLVIVAARGLTRAFLTTFERVTLDSGTVCGRAAKAGKPVFVKDVSVDADFAPYREFAATVPFRSVLSCPLISADAQFIGAVSVHSANLFAPTTLELQSAEMYGRHLADAIATWMPAQNRRGVAEHLSKALLDQAR